MRRAMPYPCSGPSALSVFKTIRASVPCQTSLFSGIPIGFPEEAYHRSYGNAIGELLRSRSLLVSEGFYRIQARGLAGRPDAEENADTHAHYDSQHDGP